MKSIASLLFVMLVYIAGLVTGIVVTNHGTRIETFKHDCIAAGGEMRVDSNSVVFCLKPNSEIPIDRN